MHWCEGQPERERRPVRTEERAWIHRMRVRARWKVVGALVLAALGLGGIPIVSVLAEHHLLDGVPDVVPTSFCIAGFALGFPIALLLIRDALGARRALARGARAAQVIVFGQGEDERVVLAEGSVLLARGSNPCTRAQIVEIHVATLPPDVVPREPDQDGWIERTLTNEELREIRATAHRLGRPHWLLWAWTGMAVFAMVRTLAGEAWRMHWFVGLAVQMLLWLRVLSARRTRRRLEADAAGGLVCRAVEGEHAGMEVLPASGQLWTVRGEPAPWRTDRR